MCSVVVVMMTVFKYITMIRTYDNGVGMSWMGCLVEVYVVGIWGGGGIGLKGGWW